MKVRIWQIIFVSAIILLVVRYVLKEDYSAHDAFVGSLSTENMTDLNPQHTNPSAFEKSSNEPAPSNLPIVHTGELCSQCIGNCHLRIWAGVYKASAGSSDKEYCIQKCNDICINFD